MSVVRKVLSDSAFTGIRSIFTILRAIIVIPLITNLLGPGSYGVWVTIIAVVSTLSATGEVHLHGSLIRYSSKEKKLNQTYSDILALSVILGGIVSITVVGLSLMADFSSLLDGEIMEQNLLGLLTGVIIFLEVVFFTNLNYPRAHGNVKIYDSIHIFRNLIESVVLMIIFLLGGTLIAGLIGLISILILINALIVMGVIITASGLPWPNPSNFREYLRYGVPMTPQQLSTRLIHNTDKYLLLVFSGPAIVGIYAVADTICKPLRQMSGVLNPTLYPTIAKEWDEGNFSNIVTVYKYTFRYYIIIGVPSIFGIILLAEPLMELISTAAIARNGFIIVPLLVLGYFVKGFDSNLRYVLTAASQTKTVGILLLTAFVFNFIMNLILIPSFGITGAALTTLLTYLGLFCGMFYFALKSIPIEVKFLTLIPKLTFIRSIFSAVVMSGVLQLIDFGLATLEMLFIMPIIGATIYFMSLLLVGEYRIRDIKRMIKKANEEFT